MSENRTHSEYIRGTHCGIHYEVCRWKHLLPDNVSLTTKAMYDQLQADEWIYTSYLKLHQKQFKPEDWKRIWLEPVIHNGRAYYEYYKSELAELHWHGEITFYEKFVTADREDSNVIKVGDDWNHYFDKGNVYCQSNGSSRHQLL